MVQRVTTNDNKWYNDMTAIFTMDGNEKQRMISSLYFSNFVFFFQIREELNHSLLGEPFKPRGEPFELRAETRHYKEM